VFNTANLPSTSAILDLPSVDASNGGTYNCLVNTSVCVQVSTAFVDLTVAAACDNTTSVIFTIAGQTVASFNSSYRDSVFIPGLIGILAELGINITAGDIFIVSVTDGSAIVEVAFLGPEGDAALQAFIDLWDLENDAILPKHGLSTISDIRAGSAVVIVPTTTSPTSSKSGDGGSDNTGAIVGGVVGGVLGFAVLCICIVLLVLLIVFIVWKGSSLKMGASKKWKQQNWWEEDDL